MHNFKVKFPKVGYENHSNLLTWLTECVGDSNWNTGIEVEDTPQEKKILYYFCFKNEEDAVWFKTVWYLDNGDN